MPNRTCLECGKIFFAYPSLIKRGGGKFCSISCGVKHRNKINNPAKRLEVRLKISLNHADVSGKNNPMYGKKGKEAPGYIDGRNSISGDTWRKIALINKPQICEICGVNVQGRKLHVHHKDKNRKNNDLKNLQVVCVECHNKIVHPRKRDSLGRFTKEVV